MYVRDKCNDPVDRTCAHRLGPPTLLSGIVSLQREILPRYESTIVWYHMISH